VTEDDIGVLLVEHDMSLVMAVSDYIYVMDFGTPIYDGDPQAVQRSEVVRAAYLGGAGIPSTEPRAGNVETI
jgi:ABC-type branched-subunit amino acid transport system ATPase component